jgi:hypothetical protein
MQNGIIKILNPDSETTGGFSITGLAADRPILMAMGDSLAQGCRSLSVTDRFCSECFGAVIAKFQKWNFVTPAYPKPVLFDLEEILSQVDGWLMPVEVPWILDGIRENIGFWTGSNWASSKTAYHDNVAITGAVLEDLVSYDSKYYDEQIQLLAPQSLPDLFLSSSGQGGDLHRAITGRYALNPSNRPELADMTQLKWVEYRKPKYLVVESGHNSTDSGFFGTGFDARPIVDDSNPSGLGFDQKRYVTRMSALVDALLTLPAGAPEKIFLGQLPKISFIVNLEPHGPVKGNYFETYWAAFGLSNSQISAQQMAAADQAVADANKALADYIARKDPAGRIVLINHYQNFAAYDYKHGKFGIGYGKPLNVSGLALDNNYIDGTPIPSPIRGLFTYKFNQGGLGSLDGCHLSAIGYTLCALSVMELMAKTGETAPTPAEKNVLLAEALDQEALLVPHMLGQVEMIRQYLNALATHQRPPDVTTQSTVSQVIQLGRQATLR